MAYFKRFGDDEFLGFVRTIAGKVKSGEDAEEIVRLKKLFKKNIPFGMRTNVGVFIAKLYLERNGSGEHSSYGQQPPGQREFSHHTFHNMLDIAQSVTIYIGVGRTRHVFVRDIISLLVVQGGLPRSRIGEIRVLDSYTFVQLHADDADEVIKILSGCEFHGRNITVGYSKKNDERPEGDAELLDEAGVPEGNG
jgi:hypothetical protein